MSSSPESGWYDDPTGRHRHRYWDGSSWTDHVADGGEAALDPVEPRARRGAWPRNPVLWVLLVAIPVAAIVLVLVAGDDEDSVGSIFAGESDSAEVFSGPGFGEGESEFGEEFGEPDSFFEEDSGVGQLGARRSLDVVEQGFSTYPAAFGDGELASFAVVVENPDRERAAQFVRVDVVFRSPDGSVIDTESRTITVIPPGERAAVAVSGHESPGDATLEASAWVELFDEPQSDGTLTATNISTRTTDFGLRTTADVRSTFNRPVDGVEVIAVYRDASGAIVGGASGFVGIIPPGGSAAAEVETSGTIPGVEETDVYVVGAPF